ncbi:MAG TPA: nucleotide pyrophosphohydrolase [Zeimonas sp.]|jgi:NTP pyrophosphatase (non-canonical NTP hydrolase)|nr:nucleotide pyrophosphohydrolase [Zeimonas sp.]
MGDSLDGLRDALRAFAADREWERFHSPKNLASALIVEAAELLEPFQWLDEGASRRPDPETLEQVRGELADVLLYLVRLADVLGIDPIEAARRKLAVNARRYPVEQARGNARKSRLR